MRVEQSHQFKKDLKKAIKSGLPISELYTVVDLLKKGVPLPPKYCDHPLRGEMKGTRDCHIRGDWILVYRIDDERIVLKLLRTGTHSELFGNSLKVDAAKVVRNALLAMQ